MGRPKKIREFSANDFTQMIASQARTAVINNLMGEFNRNKANSPAKQRMVDAIKEGMYDRYTPSMYERRETNRGLMSKNNIRMSYRFMSDKKNNVSLVKQYVFSIRMANVTKPAPLKSASGWYTNALGGQLLDFNSKIREQNIDDLLYYWKDQGLVYNLFADPKFDRWGSPTHFNDILSRKYFKEGRLHQMFGTRFHKQLMKIKSKVK